MSTFEEQSQKCGEMRTFEDLWEPCDLTGQRTITTYSIMLSILQAKNKAEISNFLCLLRLIKKNVI